MLDIDISLVEKARAKSSQLKELLDSFKDTSDLEQYQDLMIKKYLLDLSLARYEKLPCQKYKEDLLIRLQDISD